MAWSTPIASIGAASDATVNSLTSGSINTTGANFLAVTLASYYYNSTTSPSIGISDSKSNSWTPLNAYGNGSTANGYLQIWICPNTSKVGSGHTFTATVSASGTDGLYMWATAFSGGAASPLDQQSGNNFDDVSPPYTYNPGVTPSIANELILAAYSAPAYCTETGMSINNAFTSIGNIFEVEYDSLGVSLAYLIDSGTSTLTPTWSPTAEDKYCTIAIASFKAASGGASAFPEPFFWWNPPYQTSRYAQGWTF